MKRECKETKHDINRLVLKRACYTSQIPYLDLVPVFPEASLALTYVTIEYLGDLKKVLWITSTWRVSKISSMFQERGHYINFLTPFSAT